MTRLGDESAETRPLVAIYADESCLGNGREGSNPGGAAGVIEYGHPGSGKLTRWDYWVSEPATTNNRMALRSVIEAFRGISRKGRWFRVAFTSDSQYLVKGTRIAVRRRGRHEYVVIPLTLRLVDGRELVTARNPTTGHELTIYLDEVDAIEAMP